MINEQGGENLYGFIRNSPLDIYDILGMWGDDVHQDLTARWAIGVGIKLRSARGIGRGDALVDILRNPINRSDDNWGWHFNRFINGDSRFLRRDQMLRIAQINCRNDMDDPDGAAHFLGQALHPDQDWVAHGDYNRREEAPNLTFSGLGSVDVSWYWHNWGGGPLGPSNGSMFMPDDQGLDADGSIDGRPTIDAMRRYGGHRRLLNDDTVFWVLYHHGSRRILLTRERTQDLLRKFQDYVRTQEYACKCRSEFL